MNGMAGLMSFVNFKREYPLLTKAILFSMIGATLLGIYYFAAYGGWVALLIYGVAMFLATMADNMNTNKRVMAAFKAARAEEAKK